MWADLWDDFQRRAARLATGGMANDAVDETIRWQLDGDEIFVGEAIPLARLQLPVLFCGLPSARTEKDWSDRWVMFVQLNPSMNVAENHPDLSHRSSDDRELITYFEERFAHAPPRQRPAWHRRTNDPRRGGIGGLAVYDSAGELLATPPAWANVERVLCTAAHVIESLGNIAMIADAVPWKFRNWGRLDSRRQDELIQHGQRYLAWTITTYKPPLVVAMGGDSRRALAMLCGFGDAAVAAFAAGSCTERRRVHVGAVAFDLIGTLHPSAQFGGWERAEPLLTASLRDWFRSTRPQSSPAVIRRRPAR